MKEELLRIPVDQIEPHPHNPRGSIDLGSVKELADSIKEIGVIEPILVVEMRDPGQKWKIKKYLLVAGYRRWTAARFDPGNGVLIKIGEPFEIDFYAEGRKAARAEIDRSIDTGLPLLLNACEQEETPEHRADARAQLAAQVAAFNSLLGAWA